MWLLERGVFEPLTPDSLPPWQVQLLARKLATVVPNLALATRAEDKAERLYFGKIPDLLLEQLRRSGLLDADDSGLDIAPVVQQVLIGAVAQQFAISRSNSRFAVGTVYSLHTQELDIEQALMEVIPGRQALQALDLLVDGLVPTPPEEVSFDGLSIFARSTGANCRTCGTRCPTSCSLQRDRTLESSCTDAWSCCGVELIRP